jgi:hypothetical protein
VLQILQCQLRFYLRHLSGEFALGQFHKGLVTTIMAATPQAHGPRGADIAAMDEGL